MRVLKHNIPTLFVLLAGILGTLLMLWAWQLPPFGLAEIRTSNAYVRGSVTTLSAQAAGEVVEVPVTDFRTVSKGDVLVRIDDRSAKQALAQAEARLASAEAALDGNVQSIRSAEATLASRKAAAGAAEAALEIARATDDRQHQLLERGVVSDTQTDDADLALRRAEATLTEATSTVDVARESVAGARVQSRALEAEIASAEAAVSLARLDLEHRTIRAPADGRLGQIGVRRGQFVTAGTAVMSLVPENLWVIANVKETELADLYEGQEVSFTVDALRDRSFTGRVAVLSPATASEFSVMGASTATGNFTKIAQRLPVRIEIDPDQPGAERLAPGLSVVLHASRHATDVAQPERTPGPAGQSAPSDAAPDGM
ncbi:HlyD family secretion protein [Roseicyclus sp. F158]|uniref:HlyD family secretion protein n=1 Tax=Tropicimonas omnivorans TaxID=3075590 RepID=A0ABU3DJE9_9RHOB|nr:HlyD family secretion protein [Roseicyclus sp. F158]MDT0683846.1 HlyD family secretion protein [Roseicyclus sp. F158]